MNDICLPVEKQNRVFAKHEYTNLQQLELADCNHGCLTLEIDILIGTHDHWNFIGVHQVSNKNNYCNNTFFESTIGIFSCKVIKR